MRTISEIINEINQVQIVCDRLTMDIGQSYARTRLPNDNGLVSAINQKIEAFKKAESQLRTLEQELANSIG